MKSFYKTMKIESNHRPHLRDKGPYSEKCEMKTFRIFTELSSVMLYKKINYADDPRLCCRNYPEIAYSFNSPSLLFMIILNKFTKSL